jgi:uncharacterized SAM-binding protein YcdF (DUF218 family)
MRAMIPRISTVALWRSLRRMISVVGLLALIALGAGAAIVVQAGRSDSPPADAAVVMLTGDRSTAARLDRARQLYSEGKISRILLVGDDGTGRATLEGRGVQPGALIELDEDDQIAQLASVSRTLEQERLGRALLIAEPVETLRLLKIARDQDLRLLSLPTSVDADISLNEVVREIGRYFSYVLLNR